MKNGAFDYLEKPFKVDELRLCVQRALSYNAAISETALLRKQLKKKYQFSQIIGSAPNMQEVFKMIERVADTDSTILILGESGTGKELVARALHFNSRRQFAPVRPHQLQRSAGKPARIRIVRPSPRRFHRRHQRQEGPVPGSRRRHDFPR